MQTRPSVDFNFVEPKHAQIHLRLENWARWSYGGSTGNASPMFRLYRPDEHWEGQAASVPIDGADASRIGKGVAALPTSNRLSVSWCYIKRSNPRSAAQSIGTSLEGLLLYIRDARQMLLNRRV